MDMMSVTAAQEQETVKQALATVGLVAVELVVEAVELVVMVAGRLRDDLQMDYDLDFGSHWMLKKKLPHPQDVMVE